LDAKLAAASLTIDVLQITGDMDKDEKFAFIRLFTSVISLADFHPRALIAREDVFSIIVRQSSVWQMEVPSNDILKSPRLSSKPISKRSFVYLKMLSPRTST